MRGVLAPAATTLGVTAIATAVCLSAALLRIGLVARAATGPRGVRVGPWKLASLDDRELPVYSVLVPLYREAAAVPRLIPALRALDYPSRRLDLPMICEPDDAETIAALRAQRLGSQFRVLVVPDTEPKTKPKALDYALAHARGQFVVVFAAGDEPDPDQLKQALLVLGSAPAEVACVQAKLDCSNVERNLLTRWFAAERTAWFDLVLPGLQAIRAPFPLGGSSSHFRTDVLRELGGWDPYNVADDGDLGVRLRRRGYRALVLQSFTFEQANVRLGGWARQRSRWIKGQIQSWHVHMRRPLQLRREPGWRGWTAFQLTTAGSALAALVTPVCWLLLAVRLLEWAASLGSVLPPYVFYAAAAILVVCSFAPAYGTGIGETGRGLAQRVSQVALSPLYWLMISFAAWRGALQLLTRSAYWETPAARMRAHEPPGGAVLAPDLAALSEP